MKKIGLFVIASVAVFLPACLPDVYDKDYRDEKAYDNQEYSFAALPYTVVEIMTENGEITSTVSESDSIAVTLHLSASGYSEDDAEEHLANIDVNIDTDTVSGRLSVRVYIPQDYKRDYGCDVTLKVPDSVFVDLETSNGKIEANGHRNGLNILTSNGEIEISSTAGDADLETSNGEIDVDRHEGKIEGQTSNGSVTADVIMPINDGYCRFESSNGKIALAVPDSTGAEVTLRTSVGNVDVIGLNVNISSQGDGYLEGSMGTGTGTIYLKTSVGDVTLEKLQ
ncbi:DUF4097 family beta strand repeat protein [candidate division WOR-3 bacterium]|nr:DUF4097 family beta strand repeat protein [candidate division WOR-3 bacterium]